MASPTDTLKSQTLKEEALRRLSGYPTSEQDVGQEYDPGIVNPMLAPDDVVGPAELKAAALGGKAMITGGAMPIAAGIINSRAARTAMGRLLELKPGQTIMEAGRRIIADEPDAVGYGGIGAAESAGKTMKDYISSKLDEARKLGTQVYENPSQLGNLAPEYEKTLKSAAGLYEPATNRIILNPKAGTPIEALANTAGHEVEHAKDALVNNADLSQMVNYAELNPEKKAALIKHMENIGYPTSNLSGKFGNDYNKLNELAQSQAMLGETKNPEALVNMLKQGHFSNYKNYELENAMNPLVKSMDELTPEELQYLKKYPSFQSLLKK